MRAGPMSPLAPWPFLLVLAAGAGPSAGLGQEFEEPDYEAIRPGLVATDVQMHYLAQTRAGPARTAVSVVRDAPDHSVLAVEVVDAGAADHLLAVATVTVQPAWP